ncbi:hypothetical protein EVG20_g2722 [Dentipellis fragilis]|uniref:DUF6593 domain-containing protein n=1 Tax=Dentipellis fragilis TaxID=205917 RepID=A0A4Y9Z8Y7_9AGAM|nr:hypothetical protein EVG20_g2722 [Dentipellis fragilis]
MDSDTFSIVSTAPLSYKEVETEPWVSPQGDPEPEHTFDGVKAELSGIETTSHSRSVTPTPHVPSDHPVQQSQQVASSSSHSEPALPSQEVVLAWNPLPPASTASTLKSATYLFSPSSFNTMLLLPSASNKTTDTRPLYHISVHLNCLMPSSYITIIRKGARDSGEYAEEFEMGVSKETSSVTLGCHRSPIASVLTTVRSASRDQVSTSILSPCVNTTRSVSANLARQKFFRWKMGSTDFMWKVTTKPTYNATCFERRPSFEHPPEYAHLVPAKLSGMVENVEDRLTSIRIRRAGWAFVDHIVVSALILEPAIVHWLACRLAFSACRCPRPTTIKHHFPGSAGLRICTVTDAHDLRDLDSSKFNPLNGFRRILYIVSSSSELPGGREQALGLPAPPPISPPRRTSSINPQARSTTPRPPLPPRLSTQRSRESAPQAGSSSCQRAPAPPSESESVPNEVVMTWRPPSPAQVPTSMSLTPATYLFSPASFNSMLLLPSSSHDTTDTRPLYHISVHMNCLMPSSYITIVRRGASEAGQYVGEFEMGISKDTATVTLERHRMPIARVISSLYAPLRDQKQYNWKFRDTELLWKVNMRPTYSAVCTMKPKGLDRPELATPAPGKQIGHVDDVEDRLTSLRILPAGKAFADHIVVSALILERMRLTSSSPETKILYNYWT